MCLKNILSKQDVINILELIQKSLSCTNEEDFRMLMVGLGLLIKYDFAVCVNAKIVDNDAKTYCQIINISYPDEWLKIYFENQYHLIDPIVKENLASFNLQYWADTYKKIAPPKNFLYAAEDLGLKHGYTYGISIPGTINKAHGSLFSISGKTMERNTRTEVILEQIIPHFHRTLARIFKQQKHKNNIFSKREVEVLRWLMQGKSSWEIGMIFHVSERTINFHVNNIMQRLGVAKRAQAVAVAMEMGLIDIE